METMNIEKDIKVYFIDAKSFPEGILEAHEKLHSIIPFSKERRYFGISRPEKDVIVYKVAAEVLETDHEKEINCHSMIIEKGRYRCITISNFMEDNQGIEKAFNQLITFDDINPNGYCIEWYFNDNDVKCMVRLKDTD